MTVVIPKIKQYETPAPIMLVFPDFPIQVMQCKVFQFTAINTDRRHGRRDIWDKNRARRTLHGWSRLCWRPLIRNALPLTFRRWRWPGFVRYIHRDGWLCNAVELAFGDVGGIGWRAARTRARTWRRRRAGDAAPRLRLLFGQLDWRIDADGGLAFGAAILVAGVWGASLVRRRVRHVRQLRRARCGEASIELEQQGWIRRLRP